MRRVLALGPDRAILVAIASDGAGSASFGAAGAAITCRIVSTHARAHFTATDCLPTQEDFAAWLDAVRDRIEAAATPRAANLRDFAATLVCVLATPVGAVIAHVGDGASVLRRDGEWVLGSWPESGEYASTTYFVTDEMGPRLRVASFDFAPDAVAVLTDGIERLVLDFASQKPHAPFFDRMIAPVSASNSIGRDAALSSGLGRYLDGEEICQRTDDDKTLILAVRR
jgi:hypothetical protein